MIEPLYVALWMLTVVAFVGLSGTLLDEQQPASMVPPDKSFNAPAAARSLDSGLPQGPANQSVLG